MQESAFTAAFTAASGMSRERLFAIESRAPRCASSPGPDSTRHGTRTSTKTWCFSLVFPAVSFELTSLIASASYCVKIFGYSRREREGENEASTLACVAIMRLHNFLIPTVSTVTSETMASSSPVAVWEWEDDGNLWISYDPFVSTGLERAKQKRAAKIRLKDLTAELSRYVVDFTTMKQIREDTGRHYYFHRCRSKFSFVSVSGRERNVRRVVFPATSPAARAVIWEWEDRGVWSAYDNVVGQLLEDHYSRNAFSVVPLHRHTPLPYEVDLSAWRQKNVVTGFSRTVRRRPLSCTYPQVSAETVTSRKQVASASSYKGTKAKVSKSSGVLDWLTFS